MRKNTYIIRLIYSLFVIIFLINIFIKNPSNISKIIIFPFLMLTLINSLKYIFLILNKKNYVNLFNKLFKTIFIIFIIIFLIIWCYLTNTLFLLLILLSIIGIYKFIFKKNKTISNLIFKINFKIIISSFLVITCLVSGIVMLYIGIKDTYKLSQETKNYITINGYYSNYDIYDSDEDGTTYKLTYVYEVNNQKYYISTNYGTNYIPKENSIRTIKYNPSNPSEAILVGTNSKNTLIFMGLFFALGSFTFILGVLSVLGYFDKMKIDIVGTYIGFVFLIIGTLIIIYQNSITLSLIETIKSFGLWILIPIMFIVVGIIQIIKCLVKNNK